MMPIHPINDIPSPFGDPPSNLPTSDLRETAYEILLAACRSSGPKPLTFISQSERGIRDPAPAASLHRSRTSMAASKVKKALGLKTTSSKSKRAVTTGELVRVHMKISEQSESRIRRALLRIAAAQLGRRMETVVLPLELIQLFKVSDFSNQQEYEAWLRRNLKVLEAGLLLHPHVPLNKADTSAQKLRRLIGGALEKPTDIANNGESMQTLRSLVISLSCRSSDGSVPETCHWADGFPMNLWIYQTLLEVCFDSHADTCVIEEVDEVLELIKKTWVMLGINETLHNICFTWVLFHRYVVTREVESDLLFASCNLLGEVEKDTEAMKNPFYSKTLSSTLSLMLGWAEKRLLAYHDTFHNDNIESMESVVSLAALSTKILAEDISHEHNRKKNEADVAYIRVESYIRSSVRAVFIQKLEKVDPSKHLSRKQNKAFPILSVLARDITELAFKEKAIFSPKLKRWHPLAAGVAVATLHVCYGNELKKYVKGINELTPDAIEVLMAADKLEKELVQIAVEDSVDSEDGGKSIIMEIQPYEAEAIIANLVKSWINIRVDRLAELVDRILQQEAWNPQANKEGFAPSAVQVLRFIDDTLEAFFLLPISMHAVLLPELISGLDKSIQQYILKAKSGCGNRKTFIPTMPALTRCSTKGKYHGVFRKKEKPQPTQRRKSLARTTTGDSSFDVPHLCVRINTMQRIRMELGVLEKRIVANLSNSNLTNEDDIGDGASFKFSAAAAVEGIRQLCECIAYKAVFQDLCHVLWDGLYVGEVSSARIEPFLHELEEYLEIISSTVHDKVRTRVIIEVMRASFDGFLLVLLAGGASRAFSLQDSSVIEEDFKLLSDLFWSNGDGLPAELIKKHSATVRAVLPLFHTDTQHIIQQFSQLTMEMYGSSAKSRLPLPPKADQWSPREPDTLLRVLCYRNDEAAAKLLKKNYNLPTKI
ncbi:protein unc-13 protein [Trifolium repens]|nr:protein unc-13 protein [Trifolium repens]